MSVIRGRTHKAEVQLKKTTGIYSSAIPVLFWFPQFEPYWTDVDIIHNAGKSCKI